MEESRLVKVLVAIGIVSLSALYVSNLMFVDLMQKFMSGLVPSFFCEKDNTSMNYVLSLPASLETCDGIDVMQRLASLPTICDGFSGAKNEACLGLVGIVEKRSEDCISMFLGENKTSVEYSEVDRYCTALVAA